MRYIFLVFLAITVNAAVFNDNPQRVANLNGYWKFEIGDNLDWADPLFDDGRWEEIIVPSTWEDEGFPGYDGFAWYRTTFTLKPDSSTHPLYLKLGAIDDVDEVYLNGHFIGYSGGMPPNYWTWAHNLRTYGIKNDFLNSSGENVLAIRVYDGGGLGGITWGDSHIARYPEKYIPEIDLSGTWKFKKGDQAEWKTEDFDDGSWQGELVPALWCAYGLRLYDGFAWYRKSFRLPDNLRDERLILLLGEIDDMDETYLNGVLIGQTGNMKDNSAEIRVNHNDRWILRAYYIPGSVLHYDKENKIAVRVYDGTTYGGIYDGPVGIITRGQYLKWKNKKKPERSFFEWIFDNK